MDYFSSFVFTVSTIGITGIAIGVICACVLMIIILMVLRRKNPRKNPAAPFNRPPLPPPLTVGGDIVDGFDLYHSKIEDEELYTEIPELQKQVNEKILNFVERPTEKEIDDAYNDPNTLMVANDYVTADNFNGCHGEQSYDRVSLTDVGKSNIVGDVGDNVSINKRQKSYENVDVTNETDQKIVKLDERDHPIGGSGDSSAYQIVYNDENEKQGQAIVDDVKSLHNPYELIDDEKRAQATVIGVKPLAVSDSDYRRTIDKNTA